MNSFSTEEATLCAIAKHKEFRQSFPVSFVQNRIPKIWKHNLQPAEWSSDPAKEWCPPGHGDLYTAIDTSGILDQLLDAGFEYAFVSNSDNLGATLDCKILGYLALQQVPFLMEVAHRSPADRKGGHLARRGDGQLILRELAQCPSDEVEEFQNIERYRFFNTNNLWINLRTLRDVLDERHGVLGLPLIRNEKTIDATQPNSPRVYQLETAMGSAIAVFDGAQALCVPRSRFAPVKKCSDLLLLWSDVYQLTEDYHLVQSPARHGNAPTIVLDDAHYALIEQMKMRFPYGAPSLIDCNELRIGGDVRFGRDVIMRGKVQILHKSDRPYLVPDGTMFEGPNR